MASNGVVVLDFDDMAADHESNGMNWLINFKYKYPDFKVTLFTILGRWEPSLLRQLKTFEWIQFAAHGMFHELNEETYLWTQKNWFDVLDYYEKMGMFQKIFKAPNWQMSRLGYQTLKELGWAVAVRQHQIQDLPEGIKYYCFETNPLGVHGHTWLIEAHINEGLISPEWGKDTKFEFVSNHLETK